MRPRYTRVHWKRTPSGRHPDPRAGNVLCKDALRVAVEHLTTNVDKVTCKACRKRLALP